MEIEIDDLTKVYRGTIQALTDLDLHIPSGMFGLLGPNGAGKTTLMRILAGILRPSSGTIQAGPYDLTTRRGRQAIKRVLGYLPQELGLYPDLSAYEFLDYVGILKGLHHAKTRHQRVEQLLELVSLHSVAHRPLKTFSGGMKRRVGIAQALLNDPQLLIVDEPTAGLDPEERIRVRNLLCELAGNCTILLSTHIVEDIAQTCQHLALLQRGRITFQGTIPQLLDAAHTHVWLITTGGNKPGGDFTIVSTLKQGQSTQYRVVGASSAINRIPADSITMVATPTLEDAYIWHLCKQRAIDSRADTPMSIARC